MSLGIDAPEAKMAQRGGEFEAAMGVVEAEQNLPPAEIIQRKLIRSGSLEFQTEEVKKTKLEIEKICKELNAYISSESENNFCYQPRHRSV